MKKLNFKIIKNKWIFGFMFFMILFASCNKSYANMQNPVRYLNVTRIASTVDNAAGTVTPNIRIKWEPDTPSYDPDNVGTSLTDPSGIHQISYYEIYLQSISENEGSLKKVATVPANITEYELKDLKSGVIYKVAVRPIHYHSYIEGDEVKNDKPATQTSEDVSKIFMTDPAVSVTTEGTDIVVKFDDAGSWVNYRIYYEQKSDVPFEDGFASDAGVYVDRNSNYTTSTVEGSRTKLIYRLTGRNDIKAGRAYSVAVVAFDVGNDDYTIAMNNSPNIYTCATEAPFNVVEESNEYIKLTWSGLNTISTDINAIIIYAGSVVGNLEEYARITNDNAKAIEYYLIEKPTREMHYQIKVIYNDADGTEAESKVVSYNPSLINVIPGKPSLSVLGDSEGVDVTWGAFFYEGEINFDTYYDILITDDVSLISQPNLNIETDYSVSKNSAEGTRVTESGNYTKSYTEYLTPVRDTNGEVKGYTISTIKENKVYYVRVIGKTKTNNSELSSEPAVVAFYVNSSGNLYMPPVLAKPPLAKKEVTDKSITVEWKKRWYEVTDITSNDANKSWVSKLWVYNDVVYYTEEEAKSAGGTVSTIGYYDVSTVAGLTRFRSLGVSSDFISRQVGFGDDINYESYIMKEKEVEEYIKNRQKVYAGYDVEDFIASCEDNEEIWTAIAAVEDPTDSTRNSIYAIFNGLTSNTSYFIMIRSYRLDEYGNKVYATSASSIIATTTLEYQEVEPTPTVPALILVEAKDISAMIEWQYNRSLSYELRYNTTESLEGATVINITNEMINAVDANTSGDYFLYEIFDLFPETGYYFWIKAKQITGEEESAWSNPLMFTTATLQPDPLTPPGGIGIASIATPVDDNFLTIEWTRTDEDISLDNYQGEKVHKAISYVLEISDNIKFLDSKSVELGGTESVSGDFIVMDKTVVRAINLKSNTRYYVRVKTKITVTEDGTTNTLEKESSWSIIKIFRTKSTNEYDSDFGELDVPLEEKTETIYSSNKVKINILNDERVINEMIELGTFTYTFDFSNEKSKYIKREAYIPISVLKAMQSRDMNIVVKLDNMSFSVNAKAFINADYTRLAKSGGVTGLILTVNDDSSVYAASVISKEIGAMYETKYGNVATTYLEDYMDVQFDITNATYYGNGNATGVVYDSKTRTWSPAKEQYTIGYDIVFKTGKTGKVGVSY